MLGQVPAISPPAENREPVQINDASRCDQMDQEGPIDHGPYILESDEKEPDGQRPRCVYTI